MPINVRYGDAGTLGTLAVQAGKGREFAQRFQQEQQLINSAKQHYIQQDALRLEATRMQQANALRQSMVSRSGAAPGGSRRGASPLSASIQSQVPQPSQRVPGLSANEQNVLDIAMKAGDRDTVNRILSGMLSQQDERVAKARLTAGDRTFSIETDAIIERDAEGDELSRTEIIGRRQATGTQQRKARLQAALQVPGLTDEQKQTLSSLENLTALDDKQIEDAINETLARTPSVSEPRMRASQSLERAKAQLTHVNKKIDAQRRLWDKARDDADPERQLKAEAEMQRLQKQADTIANTFSADPGASGNDLKALLLEQFQKIGN